MITGIVIFAVMVICGVDWVQYVIDERRWR